MKKLINLTGLASPHLSRKITYLLMLLVSLIWSTGTAWADYTIYSYDTNAYSTQASTIDVTGGRFYSYWKNSTNSNISSGNKNGIKFDGVFTSDSKYHVLLTLNTSLKSGDKITITQSQTGTSTPNSSNNNIYGIDLRASLSGNVVSTAWIKSSDGKQRSTSTITVSGDLIASNTIYLTRNNEAIYLHEVVITRDGEDIGTIKSIVDGVTTWDFTKITQAQAVSMKEESMGTWVDQSSYIGNPVVNTATYWSPSWCEGIQLGVKGSVNDNTKSCIYVQNSNNGYYLNGDNASLKVTIPQGANTLIVTASSTVLSNGLTYDYNSTAKTYTVSVHEGDIIEIHRSSGGTGIQKIVTKYVAPAGPTANFSYGETASLDIKNNAMTIPVHATQAGNTITVNITPSDGATTTLNTGNATLNANVLTLTAPAAGSDEVVKVDVTKDAVTTTYTLTVNTLAKLGSVFNEETRYSQLLMNNRLSSFKANTTATSFGTYSNGTVTDTTGKTELDYVPGLVAKAVIEAVDYYKGTSMATEADVEKWFKLVENYAKKEITSNGKSGNSLDDLNAVKLYFVLKELTKAGGAYENATVAALCDTRMGEALIGISRATKIQSGTVAGNNGFDVTGGWYHKSDYPNQMWCDGQYMGPALLAQIINDYPSYTQVASSGTDWDLITKQFTITWNMLWNDEVNLLYHAFSADPTGDKAKDWANLGHASATEKAYYQSAEFWGRADGWYLFGLIDVLEQMQKAGQTNTANYTTLKGYLDQLAAGIMAKQDDASGCWYQLLNHDGTFSVNSYKNTAKPQTFNYLESSASAIFTASFLKAIRLGLLSKATYEAKVKKAYQGLIENFVTNGNQVLNCCRSAGLGGSNSRDGSAAYYLLGPDVTVATNETEGKALGAFIMAATEYERAYLEEPVASNDATLKSITPRNGGVLTPAFDPEKKIYTVNQVLTADNACTASDGHSSQAQTTDPNATIESISVDYTKGTQTIEVVAADGNTRAYYQLIYKAPNGWNETINMSKYSGEGATKWAHENITLGKQTFNTIALGGATMNQRFVVADNSDWVHSSTHPGLYGYSSGPRNVALLNCKKNQTIAIGAVAGEYGIDITSPNATLKSAADDVYTYTVSADGNVVFSIPRNATINSMTINDPAKVVFTATAGSNGSIAITADGNAITSGSEVEVGAKIVVTATPADGYEAVWTKTAGNDGEEGVNTYTINSITEATTIEAAFEAVSAGETVTIYNYTINESDATSAGDHSATGTIGGTATYSNTVSAGKYDTKGYKLDNDSKNIKVTLTSPNTLQAGDKIIISAEAASNNGGVYLATVGGTPTVGTNAVDGGTLSAKNTTEDLVYIVTADDILKNQSTFYVHKNAISTFIKSITIQRTTGGGSKAESPLAIKAGSAYATAGNGWTPAVGGTIALTDIISSQSTGAYSITAGDAATLENGVLTAVKNGTITLTQAADETFKAGTVDINVRIAADFENTEITSAPVQADAIVSDNAKVTINGITMTYGNDNFWSLGVTDSHGSYTGGQKNPSVTNNIPLSGTFYKFEPTKNGTITIDTKIGADKPIYVSEDGTLIAATANGQTVGKGKTLDANYSGNLVFDVKAGKTYYYYLMGSKAGLYGFSFADAVTITTQPVQPESATKQNETPEALAVVATASNAGGTLSYQWYSCNADGTNAQAVADATNASFTPSTTAVGTTYYYCAVSEANAKTINSDIIRFVVAQVTPAPTFDIATESTIAVGQSIQISFQEGATLYSRWSSSYNGDIFNDLIKDNYNRGTSGTYYTTRSNSSSPNIGNQYLYAVVVSADGVASANVSGHYNIQPQQPTVVKNPENKSLLLNEATTLEAEGGNYADSYQWVVCDDASRTNARNISGATLSTYTPPTNELGTKYYYCMVMNSKFADNTYDDGNGGKLRNFAATSVASVTVTNKVGADDYTTGFLGDIKGDKILYPGQSVNFKFLNKNNGATEPYNNFVVKLEGENDKSTDNKLYLRADKCAYYWNESQQFPREGFSLTEGNAEVGMSSTEMDGASVDLTVSYSPEKVVIMTANIITSTGKVWTYTFNSQTGGFTYTADAITAALSVDHAQLTMQDNASDLNVQESATVLQNHQIVVPYTTSSNGDVVVTHNGNEQKITSFSVDKENKTITINAGTATGMVGFNIWQKEGAKTTIILDDEGNETGSTEIQTYLAGVKEFRVTVATDPGAADVSLATLSVNGQSIEVVADQTEYTAKSPSKVVPTVTATATNPSANVTETQADAVDGTATIEVATSTTQKYYTVKFSPSAETPKDKVHWVLSGSAQESGDYGKVPEYASDSDGNIYQMIHKGANGDYYGSFLYLGGETSNDNREISFKGISGKGRVIINTRKSSDAKVGSTIQIKDAGGNVVATGTYVNQTSCATTIFTYDANQTYTVNINGRAYILSMDYVPCREDILYVEENGQRYTMTKQAEADDDYFTANTSAWTNRSINGTKYDVFNLNGTGRSLTLNVNGAQAFEIITSNGNSSPRGYTVKIGDGAAISKTAPGSATSSSGIIPTGNTGDIKITITGASDGTVYPFQVIFYSEEPEASLNTSALSVKVEKTINVALASASTGAISMTGNSDNTVATASFNSDSKVLTLTGLKEGTTQLTFNVGGDNTYKDAVATIDVTVEKQTLKLVYNPEKYTYNVDTEVETGTLNPTLTVTDEDDNIVPLNTLNITYYSDDTSIATVDASGKITKKGTGQGSADIVATLEENETYNISFAVFTVLIEQGYSTKIDSDTKFGEGNDQDNPSVGETLELKNGNNETLVYATFGGWKWGSNGEKNDHKYDLNGSTKSDAWGTPLKYTGTGGSKPTYVDGYAYAISGKTDAMDETKTPSAEAIFGKTRNGWFQSMTTDMHIKPFTLPVRGAYMTFEPQQNGMLTVYLLQNGGFNSSTASDGTSKVIPGEFQPHSFHVVDQNGTALSDYTEFDFVVKEQVTQLYGGNPIVCGYTGQTEPGVFNNNDVATWPMFYSNFTPDERAAIKNAWDLGAEKGNREHVVKLHDGSFFIPQKAYVKYTFYVAASQTYYMFSNFSKMGFAGMNFVPDEDQPDQENDVLALNDEVTFPGLKQASANVSSNLSIPQYGKITVNRNFTAGNWSSICLPFDMTEREVENVFGAGTQLMIFDGFEDAGNSATVHFVYHEIQSILAGYPYMIKPTKAITDGFAVYNKLIQPKNSGTHQAQNFDYSQPKDLTTFAASRYYCNTPYVAEPVSPIYTFTGNYNSTTIKKGDIYMSGTGEWKRYMGTATPALKGYRACIKYTGTTSAEAKPIAFSFNGIIDNFDDSATGIEDIIVTDEYDNDPVKKYAEGIYNLNGQKMNTKNLPKGIYIINGQKYNIK